MFTHVEFRSDRFPALEGEEERINPGIWGKRLADFLRVRLIAHGFEVGDPFAEDWGWCFRILNRRFPIWLGCSNYGEDQFLCFIEPYKTRVWRWFKRMDTRKEIQSLYEAINAILIDEDGIRDIRWWTQESFNRQSDKR